VSNTTGFSNSAAGANALYSNASGNNNTAFGYFALYSNTTGTYNTAAGVDALYSNTTGTYNTAVGLETLYSNTTGSANNASGIQALYNNTTGSNNIAQGYAAGYLVTTGSNNIDIGNVGAAADSGAIRIGATSKQTSVYIAGIYGISVSGSAVMVSSTGQLGVAVSSERFKTAIVPMGSYTAKLDRLRPVSFRLKSDATRTRQYGLIAEEVAKVYPELVIRNEKGRIDGVRYDELSPMLLNEAQQQAARIRGLEQQVAEIHAELVRIRTTEGRSANR